MSNQHLVNIVSTDTYTLRWKSPRDQRVLDAMLQVDRRKFLPLEVQVAAYLNICIPIGYGQSCSQPSIVAFMIDILNLGEGSRVLEIGTGCGYQTAILKKMVGKSGTVVSIEYRTELAAMAKENLKELDVLVLEGDGSCGFASFAPYQAIIFCAQASEQFNPALLAPQVPDGTLLYPVNKGEIIREKYQNAYRQQQDSYGKVRFVPLCGVNC